MTMKRLMIVAAMLSALGCGDDSSSDGDNSDSTDEKPSKDAGKADAKVDARSGSDDDDSGDDGDDAADDDVTDDDAQDAGKVDATVADAGKSDAGGDECTLYTYASFGKAFEEKYCASCHGGDVTGKDRKAAPEDAVYDTLAQIQAAKADLKKKVVTDKTMPLVAPKPTDAERVQFGKFLDCGPK